MIALLRQDQCLAYFTGELNSVLMEARSLMKTLSEIIHHIRRINHMTCLKNNLSSELNEIFSLYKGTRCKNT